MYLYEPACALRLNFKMLLDTLFIEQMKTMNMEMFLHLGYLL